MTLRLKSSHLNGSLLLNPQSSTLSSIPRGSISLPSITHRTQFQSLVLCARKKKKRIEYQRITKFLFKSLSSLIPTLQILPHPLDLVITDLGGVDGEGGLGFWRGWGRFDGWKRKRNRIPFLILVCVILWIYGYCKIFGKEIKSDEVLKVLKVLKVLGFCLFSVDMVKRLKREARYLVFGFLCFIASLAFGFKKESLVKLASRVKSCSSILLCKKRTWRRV